MNKAEEIKYITKVFGCMLTENAEKLRNGLKLREELRIKIEAGEMPQNYRTRWIRHTANKIIEALKQSSIDFNAHQENDRISNLDLVDVIATVNGLLTNEID